ncbi:hypothetical protein HK098_003490 [Nowakowskiella sp. JEL0407]|nr:hypothetical protein HK098_003490 [Nowakowskiella sp. JEL0407]
MNSNKDSPKRKWTGVSPLDSPFSSKGFSPNSAKRFKPPAPVDKSNQLTFINPKNSLSANPPVTPNFPPKLNILPKGGLSEEEKKKRQRDFYQHIEQLYSANYKSTSTLPPSQFTDSNPYRPKLSKIFSTWKGYSHQLTDGKFAPNYKNSQDIQVQFVRTEIEEASLTQNPVRTVETSAEDRKDLNNLIHNVNSAIAQPAQNLRFDKRDIDFDLQPDANVTPEPNDNKEPNLFVTPVRNNVLAPPLSSGYRSNASTVVVGERRCTSPVLFDSFSDSEFDFMPINFTSNSNRSPAPKRNQVDILLSIDKGKALNPREADGNELNGLNQKKNMNGKKRDDDQMEIVDLVSISSQETISCGQHRPLGHDVDSFEIRNRDRNLEDELFGNNSQPSFQGDLDDDDIEDDYQSGVAMRQRQYGGFADSFENLENYNPQVDVQMDQHYIIDDFDLPTGSNSLPKVSNDAEDDEEQLSPLDGFISLHDAKERGGGGADFYFKQMDVTGKHSSLIGNKSKRTPISKTPSTRGSKWKRGGFRKWSMAGRGGRKQK